MEQIEKEILKILKNYSLDEARQAIKNLQSFALFNKPNFEKSIKEVV